VTEQHEELAAIAKTRGGTLILGLDKGRTAARKSWRPWPATRYRRTGKIALGEHSEPW